MGFSGLCLKIETLRPEKDIFAIESRACEVMLSLGELRNKKLGGGFKDRQDADWPGGGEVEHKRMSGKASSTT